ncbi:PhoH family protein [Kocuria sp. JC486]|uniref:PhoH-like protein n=2 Tax=Kocuria soli TaxID=2485125 RepID=A0A3N3ZT76_9MICC|nr:MULTISPECIES: PhoH family protein [Kocuria]NHU84086.1 PhoH family protein [Kocuria sp. JC486]ROZ64821.1 PhoH family protein [Kocuria soli]
MTFADRETMVRCLGQADSTLTQIELARPGTKLFAKDLQVVVEGRSQDVFVVVALLEELQALARKGTLVTPQVVAQLLGILSRDAAARPSAALNQDILSSRGRTIRPKTLNQKLYTDAIDAHTIVFGIGPAGTGKTYLAMAKAVQALQTKEVSRIILTRPAVEAGERLGFLPGTLTDKIDPYLRPLYDALHDMLDPETIPKLMEAGTIEVAPLAYMRGRTLNDAFIILDEAQNTTPEQMKMFLTRLGFGSKIVVTGDVTQIDLPGGTSSGLRQVEHILRGVDDIAFPTLSSDDVVRHELVGKIVDAYGHFDATNRVRQERRQRKQDRAGGQAGAATTSVTETAEEH